MTASRLRCRSPSARSGPAGTPSRASMSAPASASAAQNRAHDSPAALIGSDPTASPTSGDRGAARRGHGPGDRGRDYDLTRTSGFSVRPRGVPMTNVDLVALAASRGRISEAPTVDQVTAEVVRGAMETICFEMATYVSRTATTPILNQSNERNATILDAQGRLAALSVGIPQFMLTSTLPVRFALDFLGVEEFHEGDVFVANDPYHGGGHLPDYNVFAPVFADDP